MEIVETENRPLQAAHYMTKLLQMDLEKGQTTEIEKTIGHSIHFKKHLKNCGRKLYDLKTNNFQSYNDALNFFYCSISETFKRQK